MRPDGLSAERPEEVEVLLVQELNKKAEKDKIVRRQTESFISSPKVGGNNRNIPEQIL
jgi:hypothetical protein